MKVSTTIYEREPGMKQMKLRTIEGKWIVEDDGRYLVFDGGYDAWSYIFMMKEIRGRVTVMPRSVYPVRSLVPCFCEAKKKRYRRIADERKP